MRFPSLLLAAVVAAACSSPPPPVTRDFTAYEATLSSTGAGGGRTARITLRQDGGAAVQVSSPGPSGDFFSEGTWREVDKKIVIELSGAASGQLVFSRSGDLMIGREWDRALWGEAEPVLYRVR
jgi:hypothetical protein